MKDLEFYLEMVKSHSDAELGKATTKGKREDWLDEEPEDEEESDDTTEEENDSDEDDGFGGRLAFILDEYKNGAESYHKTIADIKNLFKE